MEERLYLRNRGDMDYFLESRTTNSASVIASLNPTHFAENKLSLKNCESIANGYDLDELANRYTNPMNKSELVEQSISRHFINGAKTILEILSDKKFTESDIKKAYHIGKISKDKHQIGMSTQPSDILVQSLQQTEWEVLIEMEVINHGAGEDGKLIETVEPKLDAEGCLILKRL